MARSLLQQPKQEGRGQKGAMFGGIESGQAEGGEKKALTKRAKGSLFPDFLVWEHRGGMLSHWTWHAGVPQARTPGRTAGGTAAFASGRRTVPSTPSRLWLPCRRLT